MLMENCCTLNHTQDTNLQNKRQTLWHRCRRQREHRVKGRRKTIRRQPADATAPFEQSLLPELSMLFKRMFTDLPDHEREDAEQDCLCQSWLAYKKLPTPIAERITAVQLAVKVYRTYCCGGRFLALA